MNTTPPILENLIKTYKTDFGIFHIYPDYVVGQFYEGTALEIDQIFELSTIAEVHYENKDYAYISYRVNSYALDPTLYSHIKELENLKGIAIVTKRENDRHNFKIEQYFYAKNMEIFYNLSEAIDWVYTIID
ncbi:STAS/SEC14 domain-containing protein [Robertkochia solimangrovi]|uniref:STAS/SEC14 domain-containing protein n=1 Tax=Robertkochia solimangrovi TaxID=2213046 RepID=UPI00117E822B|nr:STAS/SEC14 domain-containing protein [Robertkochia solimangrovi]TRZ42912.1 STAS/SEC14 domain-containing protein [Robertkochia solimangrovi]